MTFEQSSLIDPLKQAVEEMGFSDMTEIQQRAIPLVLEGKDVLGQSATGSGKTAAFGLPILQRLKPDMEGVQALILCPTRELALQITGEMEKFAKYTDAKVAAVYGGQSIQTQIRRLKESSIVVGTPGRILDHIGRHTLKLSLVSMVVLDEADEMLNMGFLPDMERILHALPRERQTLLFSATMPPSILSLARRYQKLPETVEVASETRTVSTIRQFYCRPDPHKKPETLLALLRRDQPKRALVFCNTKRMVDMLMEMLVPQGIDADALHGDMRQSLRTKVMDDFKKGETAVLIATDVAARGIDVDDIDVVYNYDVPMENEAYVHRVGRTARAGKEGLAYSLIGDLEQLWKIWEIASFVDAPIEEMDPPDISGIEITRPRRGPRPERWGEPGSAARRREGGRPRKGGGPRQEGSKKPAEVTLSGEAKGQGANRPRRRRPTGKKG